MTDPTYVPPPVLDADRLEHMSEKEIKDIQQTWDEQIQRLQGRGPLEFNFEEGRSQGFMNTYDLEVGQHRQLVGHIDVGPWEEVIFAELYHPTIEALRDNPWHWADTAIEIKGATDAHVLGLVANRELKAIDIRAVIDQEFAEAYSAQWQFAFSEFKRECEEIGETLDIAMIPEPETLDQGGELLTDAVLEALHGHPMTDLRLAGTRFSDDAVADYVATAPHLTVLRIESEELTGSRLADLSLPNVEILGLGGPKLTGAAISQLPELPNCFALRLIGPHVLDGLDLAALKRSLPNLNDLEVNSDAFDEVAQLRLSVGLPDVMVNGVTMSERAARKAAAKLGVTLEF